MWWLPFAVVFGYAIWFGAAYAFGAWVDDAMQNGKVKDVLLVVAVINIIPGLVLYTSAIRTVLMWRWLLIGCKASRNDILSDFFD